jgi:CheY-like chemotaxis protein
MSVPSVSTGTCSVLIVDEYEDAAVSLALVLSLAGHRVGMAFDADSALRAIAEDRPDVVITETVLPRTSGYNLAGRISTLPGPTPILIALTTQGRREDRERIRAAGFRQFFLKPADPDELLNLLQCGRHELQPQTGNTWKEPGS